MDKSEADKILESVGWPLEQDEIDDWAVDDEILVLGGGGKKGRIMDVQPSLCLIKFPGEKSTWVDKRLLLHYLGE